MNVDAVRVLATSPLLHQFIALLKIGVPYDVIDAMTDDDRLAWVIASGLIEGSEFDWPTMRWTARE